MIATGTSQKEVAPLFVSYPIMIILGQGACQRLGVSIENPKKGQK